MFETKKKSKTKRSNNKLFSSTFIHNLRSFKSLKIWTKIKKGKKEHESIRFDNIFAQDLSMTKLSRKYSPTEPKKAALC
jgi:hypothetical protein